MDESAIEDAECEFSTEEPEFATETERQQLISQIVEIRLQKIRLYAEEARLNNLLQRLGSTTTTGSTPKVARVVI